MHRHFKLKYEDSQNVKADFVNRVFFSLHQIKRGAFVLGHPVDNYAKDGEREAL